jgi:hypothetical protein
MDPELKQDADLATSSPLRTTTPCWRKPTSSSLITAVGCALMSQIFRVQAWEERAQSPESGNIFLFEIGLCLTRDLVEWTVCSLKMNHLISQEWQEIRLRNFVHMLFDARAFKCDTLWVRECFQRPRISCSFFTIFHQKWTCYCKVLEAPKNSKSITFKSLCIKDHMCKISKPYLIY